MKRIALSVLAGTVVLGSVWAFAASLGVTSTNVGSGDNSVASCDANGVDTAYTVAYYATSGTAGYELSDVSVGDIAADCVGDAMKVQLVKQNGTLLGPELSVSAIATTTETVSVSGQHLKASDLGGLHVVINGVDQQDAPAPVPSS